MNWCYNGVTVFLLAGALLAAEPIRSAALDESLLRTLACELGISPDEELLQETQRQWLRPSDIERYEMGELSTEAKQVVINWGREQGLYDEWKPAKQSYDRVILLGATIPVMRDRLNYLKELWEHGLRCKEVIWLVGDRPLDASDGPLPPAHCRHEADGAYHIWLNGELPSDLRSLSTLFLSAPMEEREEGGVRRPTTRDTLLLWLESRPNPNLSSLIISSQPFSGYQYAVAKNTLPEAFSCDIAGPAIDPSSHRAAASITLDNLARWFYETNAVNPIGINPEVNLRALANVSVSFSLIHINGYELRENGPESSRIT